MDDRDELIRARAYEIWQAEGSPEGRDEQHWHQAARDVEEAVTTPRPAEPVKDAATGPKRGRTKAEPAALTSEPAGEAVSPKRRKAAAPGGEAASDPAPAKPVKRGRGAKA